MILLMKSFSLIPVLAAFLCFSTSTFADRTWRFAVISDLNGSYGSLNYGQAVTAAIGDIQKQEVDLVISTGDMVAGQKTGLNYTGMWNAFHGVVTRPLDQAGIPLLPSPGNHDASAGGRKFQVERDHYERTWNGFAPTRFNSARAPDSRVQFLAGVPQNYPFYYAITMGPALFIALDSTLPGGLINNQFAWLENVLNHSGSFAVKVVFGHFPLYPFAFQRSQDSLAHGTVANGFYRRMESLLEAHEVDLYLSGHHHAFYPGRRAGHVRYVSVPLLGSGARALLNSSGDRTRRSPQGYLTFEFDAEGQIDMRATESPSLRDIGLNTLPSVISIPRANASDCGGCATFPSAFFIDPAQRVVYRRW